MLIMRLRGVLLLLLDLVVNMALLALLTALAPILLLVFVVLTPWVALGLSTSDTGQVGVPASWLRWYRQWYVVPFLANLFLAIPFYTCLLGQPFVVFAVRIAAFARGMSSSSLQQQQQQRDDRSPARALFVGDQARSPGEGPPPSSFANVQDDPEAPKQQQNNQEASPVQDSFTRREMAQEMRYRDHDSVWAALEGDGDKVKRGDVRLLSLRWLHSLADEPAGVLSRRQGLPEEAFLEPEDLKRIQRQAKLKFDFQGWIEVAAEWAQHGTLGSLLPLLAQLFRRKRNVDNLLPIAAVSYCWLEAAHPDRHGHQLRLLCSKLDELYGGLGLLGACKHYGFSDMGVFIDWGSGYQKDPELWRAWMSDKGLYVMSDQELLDLSNGEQLVAERRAYEASRTNEQEEAFRRMLYGTMDIWYAHAGITVVLLTVLPGELPKGFDTARTYVTRGWTTYERCSAELAKSFNLRVALWKLVIDLADAEGGSARRLPTTPERMAELLEQCQFTNGSDKEPVLALYKKTASAVLGMSKKLDYMGLPLKVGDPWCSPALLGDALNHCTDLQQLVISGTQLTDEGVAEFTAKLDDHSLPNLEVLDIACNRFGSPGVKSLCDKLCRGVAPSLQLADVGGSTHFGDMSAEALATALATGSMPPQLYVTIGSCSIGNRGAKALAAALPHAGDGCRVLCLVNRVGFAGQVALFRALETKHGWDFANALAVMFNSPPYPVWLTRAVSLGLRRTRESGRMLI